MEPCYQTGSVAVEESVHYGTSHHVGEVASLAAEGTPKHEFPGSEVLLEDEQPFRDLLA